MVPEYILDWYIWGTERFWKVSEGSKGSGRLRNRDGFGRS